MLGAINDGHTYELFITLKNKNHIKLNENDTNSVHEIESESVIAKVWDFRDSWSPMGYSIKKW